MQTPRAPSNGGRSQTVSISGGHQSIDLVSIKPKSISTIDQAAQKTSSLEERDKQLKREEAVFKMEQFLQQ